MDQQPQPTPQDLAPKGPNFLLRIGTAAGAGLLVFGGVACSSDSNSSSETTFNYVPGQGSDSGEGATSTTESLDNSYQGVLDRLVAQGYSEELAKEILGMGEMPLHNPEECITSVADAKGGEAQAKKDGWLIAAGGELVVNTDLFVTAGEGIVENAGPNHFTDSVADDYMEGDQMSVAEVTDYFGDPTKVAERTREAVQELFANFCGDSYELASGMVATANARIGNTDVRLGEIFKGALGQYVIDGEVTQQSLTEMVQKSLDKYVIEYPAGVDTDEERQAYLAEHPEQAEKRIEAYNKQLEDAAKLISVLENFLPELNRNTTHVDVSSQIYGTNAKNYPELIFSSEAIDATGEPHGLGGEYDAVPASLISFIAKFKAGCISIEGGSLIFNLLDGRAGYSNILVSAPEGCEPIIITVPSTPPEGSIPPKNDDGELPGDGSDASQDGGTPDEAGEGDAGQETDNSGYVSGEIPPSSQAPNTTATANTTAATTGTTTATTQPAAPANTSVNTSIPQSGTLPPLPGPERIVHDGRVTSKVVIPVSERQRYIANLMYL